MLRIIVDSGSSIKQDEKRNYNCDVLPLQIYFEGKEYLDDVNIHTDEFYKMLIESKSFPKTSLPSSDDAFNLINNYLLNGDKVCIITISSTISGTFNMLYQEYKENPNVLVFDSYSCVSGVKLLVDYVNRNQELPLDILEENLKDLRSHIKILAVPENLNYLLKGGRLSKKEWLFGTLVAIKPIITVTNGHVKVEAKKRGLANTMKYIKEHFNPNLEYDVYGIYTYDKSNLDTMLKEHNINVDKYDNACPAVGCHWGPNAFGLVFVENK